MSLLGKKKNEKMKERLPAIVENLPESLSEITPENLKEQEKPSQAPLFVKLDKYKQILSTIASLKPSFVMLKNNFEILNKLEKLREENMSLIKETLERVEKKLTTLDTELIKPSGFREEMPEMYDVKSVDDMLADLNKQIEQLKSGLKTVA